MNRQCPRSRSERLTGEVWPDARDPLQALSGLIQAQHTQGLLGSELEPIARAARPLTAPALVTVLAHGKEPVAVALPFELRLE